ncbi:thymosin beta, partial [Triplophysa rosa]
SSVTAVWRHHVAGVGWLCVCDTAAEAQNTPVCGLKQLPHEDKEREVVTTIQTALGESCVAPSSTRKTDPAASSSQPHIQTLSQSALVSIRFITAIKNTMADKPNMTEITTFDKTKLRKTDTQEKNPLPTKETIEQERQDEATP